MSDIERRLSRLESHRDRDRPHGASSREFTMVELDLCLAMFDPPADMPEADRRQAAELLREFDQCPRQRLSEAEIDAELAKFACGN